MRTTPRGEVIGIDAGRDSLGKRLSANKGTVFDGLSHGKEEHMPTLTTERSDEINVSPRLVARMAERMQRMTPDRRVRYLDKAQRRLDSAQPSQNAAAAVLASRQP